MLFELCEHLVGLDELSGIRLRKAARECASERSLLLTYHRVRRGLIQRQLKLGVIGKVKLRASRAIMLGTSLHPRRFHGTNSAGLNAP